MAMVPPTQRMVLNMEYTIPSTTIRPQSLATILGRTNYTASLPSQAPLVSTSDWAKAIN